jgi:oligopeptide/dipeptide ABC transporter ATP-binding protein
MDSLSNVDERSECKRDSAQPLMEERSECKRDRAQPLLEVKDLRTYFFTDDGVVKAVDGVSFSVQKGRTLGLVGESGCGKSVTAMSITRLISPPGRIAGGEVLLNGRNLTTLSEQEMRAVRGAQISMIFQEPMTALNPVLQVGFQIAEAALAHEKVSKREAWARAVEAMKAVAIPDAEKRAKDYPHQLSGGMRQRVMIAMALICNPAVVIADEPTTALDVTIQAQILELLDSLRQKYQLSLILISHDLGVIAEVADTVAVMYAGKIVEIGAAMDVFHNPKHPYTEGLLRSVPRLGASVAKSENRPRLYAIEGVIPNLLHLPDGCSFAPRCYKRTVECTLSGIPLEPVSDSQRHDERGECKRDSAQPRHDVRCIHA